MRRGAAAGFGLFGFGLLGCLGVLALNLTIGGMAFDYSLMFLVGKDVPWYADAIAGLFLGELAIPLAIACWISSLCGVHPPLVH